MKHTYEYCFEKAVEHINDKLRNDPRVRHWSFWTTNNKDFIILQIKFVLDFNIRTIIRLDNENIDSMLNHINYELINIFRQFAEVTHTEGYYEKNK